MKDFLLEMFDQRRRELLVDQVRREEDALHSEDGLRPQLHDSICRRIAIVVEPVLQPPDRS